ncbi:MAG: 50S ribosomal protein L9 [Deltaproteobacteria bacterium]|nr:50S ribosomal protein L9 [Deltaproteobacteria bacterium]MBW1923324.1 50S ribosomal protein L9 [Deltaproteobacteria bacterium]MBW1949967.1 50S ribosomal protein L9 [Deltaproteobacteria bacterium]MBW2007912.1 50S ribosomal protein L9 [Deltaproteobacteria bacterium]MBW2101897.1 50S ribosomal protein L9 [Deltaproteobacteria bacterium]
MEVILQKDFEELGLEGEIVKVAGGYGRNYLIPKGFAVEATPQNLKALDLKRKKIEIRRLKATEEAEKVKEELAGKVITLTQKAGEEGKLYGSVTSMDIAAALDKEGVVIDRKKIVLERPIKSLGEFEVPVKLYPGVSCQLKVVVEPEEQE